MNPQGKKQILINKCSTMLLIIRLFLQKFAEREKVLKA